MKNLFIASLVVNGILFLLVGIFGYLFMQKKIIVAPIPTAVKQTTITSSDINKSWDLPATSSAKTASLSLTITTVKKSDKITAGKTQYTTKNNKSFLVVNTILENKGNTPMQVTPSDFIKLLENNSQVGATYKALATTVQPGKTYQSSMVFLINESEKSFVLSIGANVGKTETLNINF